MKRLLFNILIFACSCNYYNSNDKIESIFINLKNESINASTFIKNASIIKLETNDDCLIHRISKIKYLNQKIYILDIDNNALFIFYEDGSLHKILSKVGGGPGEYIQIMDFFIEDNFVYILDFSAQSILKYTDNLEFIAKYKYKLLGSSFVLKDDGFCIYNEYTGQKNDYQFSFINQNEIVTNRVLPRKFSSNPYNYGGCNSFAIHNNMVYASPRFSSVIYYENNNSLLPLYEIKFDKKNFPKKENIYDYDISSLDFNYVIKRNFYVSDKYVIFDYFYDQKRHYCFYEKEHKVIYSGIVDNDILKDFRFFPRWGNGNYLIEEIDSYIVLEHFNSLKDYNEQLSDIKADDNPVIILYTLKSE